MPEQEFDVVSVPPTLGIKRYSNIHELLILKSATGIIRLLSPGNICFRELTICIITFFYSLQKVVDNNHPLSGLAGVSFPLSPTCLDMVRLGLAEISLPSPSLVKEYKRK